MQRELKFRVWCKTNKEFIPGPSYLYCDYLDKKNLKLPIIYFSSPLAIISQYTGLKDCEGKEIFEGDMVEATLNHISYMVYPPKDCIELAKVIFIKSSFSLEFKDTFNQSCIKFLHSDEFSKFKVIGNIFENPELLEK